MGETTREERTVLLKQARKIRVSDPITVSVPAQVIRSTILTSEFHKTQGRLRKFNGKETI
jgi:hypothetical protein